MNSSVTLLIVAPYNFHLIGAVPLSARRFVDRRLMAILEHQKSCMCNHQSIVNAIPKHAHFNKLRSICWSMLTAHQWHTVFHCDLPPSVPSFLAGARCLYQITITALTLCKTKLWSLYIYLAWHDWSKVYQVLLHIYQHPHLIYKFRLDNEWT